jgi:NTE family protein
MIRQRKINDNNIIYTTDMNNTDKNNSNINENINEYENNNESNNENNNKNKNENNDDDKNKTNINETKINYKNIDTLVFSSSELFILSILGYLDKLLITDQIDLKNINNYVSSSLGTLVSVYLSFGYTPKDILQIFNEYLIFVNNNILNISNTFGIFNISLFIDNLLKPLYEKLNFIPTLKDIYKITCKNCVFISYNFTKNKVIVYSHKTHGNIKINELIKKCSIVPFIFQKYNNENENIDLEDHYIDYSLIDRNEYEYSIKLFNKSKIFLLKVNILKKEEIHDIPNCNILEYAKIIYDSTQQINRINTFTNIYNLKTINIYDYNKILLFDSSVRYKELIYLFCNGFNDETKNNLINNEQNNVEINYYNYSFPEDNKYLNNEYNGIVISGGGTNAFCLLGCIKYCLEYNIFNMDNINTFIGTSAGSYISTMLVLGFKFEDIINIYIYDITPKLNETLNFNNIDINERISEKSLYNNKILIESFETVFIKYKEGQIPSLLDVKNYYGKELVYCVFNVSKGKLEYLNYTNSPNLLVTQACAMSSCIPIMFNPIEYNKCFYIDSGIQCNYPIEKTNDYLDKKFIGFNLKFLSNYIKMNVTEFAFYFLMESARKYQDEIIKKSPNCDTYNVKIVYDDDRESSSTLLLINKNIINKLIDKGYNNMSLKNKKNDILKNKKIK